MSGLEVGPNDIIIHLVNPFRCGDCEEEFHFKMEFLDHIADHIASSKSEKPCHQIVCYTNTVEHSPKGITVTRDIVQINDQQVFELQDTSVDYTQLSPVKALVQAGIMKLPPSLPPFVSVSGADDDASDKTPVSLLNQENSVSLSEETAAVQKFTELSKELLGAGRLIALTNEHGGHDRQYLSTDSKVIGDIVQQAMLGNGHIVKVEDTNDNQVVINTSQPDSTGVEPMFVDGGDSRIIIKTEEEETLDDEENFEHPERFLSGVKKRAALKSSARTCLVCGTAFQSIAELECHIAEFHPDIKLRTSFPCTGCGKTFKRLNSLYKHRRLCDAHATGTGNQHQRQFQNFVQTIRSNNKHFVRLGKFYNEVQSVDYVEESGQTVYEYFLPMYLSEDERDKLLELSATSSASHVTPSVDACQTADVVMENEVKTKSDDGTFLGCVNTDLNCSSTECENDSLDSCTHHKNNDKLLSDKIYPTRFEQDGLLSPHTTVKATQMGEPSSGSSQDGVMVFSQQAPDVSELSRRSSQNVTDNATNTNEQSAVDNLAVEKVEIYRCSHCKKSFSSRPVLLRHLIKHTDVKAFQCGKCTMTFDNKSDLVSHIRTHNKPVQCHICQTSFTRRIYLQNHLSKGYCVDGNFPLDERIATLNGSGYQCKVCNRVLKNKTNALRHMRIHDFKARPKRSQPVNNINGAALSNQQLTASGLSQNVNQYFQRRGAGLQGYECLLCGEELRVKGKMIVHVLKHLNLKPYKCDHCSKSFYTQYSLGKHRNNHTRPYKCLVCGKRFIRRYMLANHFEKRHNISGDQEDPMKDITELPDQKLIQCDICGKTMRQSNKSVMQEHIRLHKDVRPFQCNTCHKSFVSENALMKHSQSHSKPYQCHVCGSRFARRYILTDHFKKACMFKVSSGSGQDQENLPATGTAVGTGVDAYLQKVSSKVVEEPPEWLLHHTNLLNGTEVLDPGSQHYFCEPCSKRFSTIETFMRHVRTFSKPMACKYCKAMFDNKHCAIQHQRSCLGTDVLQKLNAGHNMRKSETDTPSHDWQQRVKIFEKVNETIQSVSLSGSVPESVENITIIPEEETIKTNLARTIDTVMKRSGKFPCPECERVFATARGLKIHAAVHIKLFFCEVCNVQFKNITDLRSHKCSNNTSCDNQMDTFVQLAGEHGILENVKVNDSQSLQHSTAIEDNSRVQEGDLTSENRNLSATFKEKSSEITSEVLNLVSDNPNHGCINSSSCNNSTPMHVANDENSPDKLYVTSSTSTLTRSSPNITTSSSTNQDDSCFKEVETNLSPSKPKMTSSSKETHTPKLAQSGTRGRPYSCQMCRKRFTQEHSLQAHIAQSHV